MDPDPAPEARLDPEAVAICHRLAGFSFPWDITRALELALLKTFCLPSISDLLVRTGEFEQRPRKRYDDTGLMVAELLRHGPDSPEGRAVINRLNRIHSAYAIANADFLYVLSGFVAEPIRWLARYGVRPLTPVEQQALFRFWRHVGARMGITELPPTLAQQLSFNTRVEATLFATTSTNRRLADATLAMLLAGWPARLQGLPALLVRSLLPEAVTTSLGWRPAPTGLQAVVRACLRLRSGLMNRWQRLRPARSSRFYSQRPTPSYGTAFQLEQLGPPALLERLNRPRWSGPQRRIGLTGGIASGKSSVGRLLEARGLRVLDADAFAREALAPGRAGTRAVLARYGEAVRAPGTAEAIDRAALGRFIFADAAERHWLEALVHPLVRQRFDAELARLAAEPVVVLMIPLLFEAGLEGLCSEVWLVDCDPEQQRERLMGRDQLSADDAEARLAAQWPLERKRPLANELIDNRSGPEGLAEQVERALSRCGQAGPGTTS